MTYQEFLKYIFQRYSANVKLGLERMEYILAKMNSPERKIRGIHIAGTNGKGSTSAMCEALALGHNLTTGLNTSPHLIDYCERFRINGINLTPDELMEAFYLWRDVFDECEASFFEITTSLAFYLFDKHKLNTSIMEVGLGGRLDGTNPFTSQVSVITTISLDHPKTLGDTLEKIAYEKAGIIKENQPVVLGNVCETGKKVIKHVALDKNAKLFEYNKDFFVQNINTTSNGTSFDYSFPEFGINWKFFNINMIGNHQAVNAATAITAFLLYSRITKIQAEEQIIRKSLQSVNWPGRIQILHKDPWVIIDGAHNEEGVQELTKNIKTMFPDKEYVFVVAILRDKKLDKMIENICQMAKVVYISKNHSERAADIEEQVQVVERCGIPYFTSDDILGAVDLAYKKIMPNEILIITGSLYTIAEVLAKKDTLF